FSFLPPYHRFRQMAERLQGDVYLKGWKLSEYKNYLAANVQQSLFLTGENSPATDKARLQTVMFEIAYGMNYKQAEEKFMASYTNLILHTGSHDPDHQLYLQSLADLYYKTAR